MSIKFDKFEFSDPIKLNEWRSPKRPGIYVILKDNYSVPSNGLIPVLFGENENIDSLSDMPLSNLNIKLEEIYISTYLMHKANKMKRMEVVERLKQII